MQIKFHSSIGFIAPAPDNSFFVIDFLGETLSKLYSDGSIDKIRTGGRRENYTFVLRQPRHFFPVGIKTEKEIKLFQIDVGFDPMIENLEYSIDYSSGDELWTQKGIDEDHSEDSNYAIVRTLDNQIHPNFDTSSVLRAACNWPFLVWRRNLKISDYCIDPFSAVAPPGIINILSKSIGIVFANLSTDRAISLPLTFIPFQVALSFQSDYAVCYSENIIEIFKNPLFGDC